MKTDRTLWIGLGVLALLTPLGLLASGTAWGEWSSQELFKRLRYVPEGLRNVEKFWQAAFPDYSIPAGGNGLRLAFGYVFSAFLGAGLILLIVFVLGGFLTKRKNDGA